MNLLKVNQKFLNNRNFLMFLARDFSKQNLKKETSVFQTLRSCTSEKRFLVCPPAIEYIRVGNYKYREQDLVGKGFSSKVYRASHVGHSDEKYAIKVINLKKFKASNIAMLQSQIEVHRNLSHPNIVQFYDAYKTENFYYIITQYCPHGDLMEMLNQKKKIQQSKAHNIIEQVIQGYIYLSRKFILHRDLKPANVFRNGQIWKIGDFGFSMTCSAQSFYDKINVGTPLYMPLQSLKTNKYSFKSDIFALGVILYEMITGRTPWQCKTQKQLINKMKSQQIKMPSLKNHNLKRFLLSACEVDEVSRLGISELQEFFNPSSLSSNPEEKQEVVTLKHALSMRNIRQPGKTPGESLKTAMAIVSSKQSPLGSVGEPSTEVSQKSDSHRVKQNVNEQNTRTLLQQLQFCRLIYYMTKNMKYFVINGQKCKSFLTLTLFKHLLRCIKQLEEPGRNYAKGLVNFQFYQGDKEYRKLMEEIKCYSKRYEKEYLDVLKNTEISVIRAVNKRFPELSYNSALNDQFYRNYYSFFTDTLRILNHGVSINEANESDKQMLAGGYQSVVSLYAYCEGLGQKMSGCQGSKTEIFANFTQKVCMDYQHSKLERKNYQELRQRIKLL